MLLVLAVHLVPQVRKEIWVILELREQSGWLAPGVRMARMVPLVPKVMLVLWEILVGLGHRDRKVLLVTRGHQASLVSLVQMVCVESPVSREILVRKVHKASLVSKVQQEHLDGPEVVDELELQVIRV